MEAFNVVPEIYNHKEYTFNDNKVCTNPENAFYRFVDRNNYLSITLAQHPTDKRWCVGEDYASNQVCSFEGKSSPASHLPENLGSGYATAKEALRVKVNYILNNLNQYRLHPEIVEAIKTYSVTLDIVVPGQQLNLF